MIFRLPRPANVRRLIRHLAFVWVCAAALLPLSTRAQDANRGKQLYNTEVQSPRGPLPSALGTERYLTVARIDGRSGAQRVSSRRPALDLLSSWSGAW